MVISNPDQQPPSNNPAKNYGNEHEYSRSHNFRHYSQPTSWNNVISQDFHNNNQRSVTPMYNQHQQARSPLPNHHQQHHSSLAFNHGNSNSHVAEHSPYQQEYGQEIGHGHSTSISHRPIHQGPPHISQHGHAHPRSIVGADHNSCNSCNSCSKLAPTPATPASF